MINDHNRWLNIETCELIGTFIGDGYMSKSRGKNSHSVIGFAGDKQLDKEYFENYLVPLIKRNFSFTKPKIYYRNDENTIMLKIYSKRLCELFMSIGFKPGKKARTIVIPQEILEDKEYTKATIRGIFDTDGCVFFDKRSNYKRPYPRITLQVASIGLISQIEEILSKDFSLYVNKRNRDGNRNYVEIYGHNQLENFLKGIGFSNKRHIDRIKIYAPVA